MFEADLAQRRKKLLKALRGDPRKLFVLGLGLILVFLIVLYLGPLEGLKRFGLLTEKKESARAESLTRPQIDIGVDAYTKDISSQPSGLTFVYKYITPGNANIVPAYIETAYLYNLKPILVVYTNYDSTTVDWPTWDATMDAIRKVGKEVWVIAEPDLLGMIRNDKTCGTAGKADIDRFLSTKPSNAHLGILLSGWNLGDGTQKWNWSPSQEAIEWKACLTSAGGDRIEDVYFDISDRDQEFKNTYPWIQSRIMMWETFAKELSGQLGKKVGIWQISMGNSQCQNGRRSNIVETWLTSTKLSELSPYVNRLLFGPGVEDSANAQSWNLSTDTKYDCGFFNQKVTSLYGSVPTPTPTPTPKPKSSPCSFTDSTGQKRGYGDIDADGDVDDADALLMAKHSAGSITLTGDNLKAADINADGRINVGDQLALAQYISGGTTTFAVCKTYTPPCYFTPTDPSPPRTPRGYGDVDADGDVDVVDQTLIAQHFARQITLTGDNLKAADLNGDAYINSNDYGQISSFVAGTKTTFTICPCYDVPTPANKDPQPNGLRNGIVDDEDLKAVAMYTSTLKNGPPNTRGFDYDSDKNGDGVPDGQDYDLNKDGRVDSGDYGIISRAKGQVCKVV